MQKQELISVIVPVYNVEKYLRECLDSICSQTYSNLEIILVDDGSTDRSGKICDEYADKDGRIRVIHKQNGGLSSARNAGLDIAAGSYIGFVDSDDYIAPDMYEILLIKIIENNTDFVACNYAFVSKGKSSRIKNGISANEIICGRTEAFNIMMQKTVAAWNKLYKKNLFDKMRFPDGKVAEDGYIIPELLMQIDKVCFINYTGYFYRQDITTITHSKYKRKDIQFIKTAYRLVLFARKLKPECMSLAIYRLNVYYKTMEEKWSGNSLKDFIRYRKDICYMQDMLKSLYGEIKENTFVDESVKKRINLCIHSAFLWYLTVKNINM